MSEKVTVTMGQRKRRNIVRLHAAVSAFKMYSQGGLVKKSE
jgi:hypothetical protein